jgi:hypothetical protein
MSRKLRPPAALVLVALISLIGAGCGSNAPADTTTAGAGSSGSARNTASAKSSGTDVSTKATKREKAVKFAECVRAHGVPHFPDPGTSGDINFGVDVSKEVFTAAVDACKSLEPPGALSAQRSTTQQSAALRFAQCVRTHGVPDFPDPVNGQPLIDTTHIPSSNQPGGMTILNAATHKCGSVLGLAAGGGSGG